MRILVLTLALVFSGCVSRRVAEVSLAPVPYAMRVPAKIAERLSTGPVEGEFGREVERAGGLAARTVFYNPGGELDGRTVFMTAFYFPGAEFKAAANPDEPPRFGQEVLRSGGTVLAIAGPHDTIYEPASRAGRDVVWLNGRIYDAGTYRRIR